MFLFASGLSIFAACGLGLILYWAIHLNGVKNEQLQGRSRRGRSRHSRLRLNKNI